MKKISLIISFLIFYFSIVSAQVWQREAPDTTGSYNGYYCSLALDSEDNPHIAYYNEDFRDLYYASFSDGRWTVEIVDSIGDAGMECSLVLDAQDRPHISYRQNYLGLNYWKLKYATKTDDGWTKTYVDTPIDSAYFVSGSASSIAMDGDGYPVISFVREFPTRIMLARKDAEGWHVTGVTDVYLADYTRLVLDDAGNPVIGYTYLDDKDTVFQNKFGMARYDAAEGTWSFAYVPEPVLGNYRLVGFDLDQQNRAYFAYLKRYPQSSDTLRIASYDGNTWEIETVTPDAGPYSSPGITMRLDRTGHPVIVDFYYSNELRLYSKKEDQWNYQVVNNYKVHTGLIWHSSLAFDSHNFPRIAIHGNLPDRSGLFYYRYWPGDAQISIPMSAHNYGAVWTQSYAEWYCDFENTGDAPLIIDDHDYWSGWNQRYYSVAKSSFPFTILPGEKDSLAIRFTPDAEETYLDTLFLYTNDSSQTKVKVALSGEGTNSGTSGELQVKVQDIYISHAYMILKHDLPLKDARVELYRDSHLAYGPVITDAAGMAVFQDVDTGRYQLKLVSPVTIPGDEPGTTLTHDAGFSVMIGVGPGINTQTYLFPDSLLTEKYRDIYDLTHIRKGSGESEHTFHYPAESDVLSLLDTWRGELPPETDEALSRLILAEKMVNEMFEGGYSIGNEFFNDIGELINIVYYSDSWGVAMWKWAFDAIDAIFTHDVQPLMKDMLIQVLKEFLKSMIMDLVTDGIHHITAELGQPGETIFNSAWELVRSNYSSWSIGDFSSNNWEKTIRLVFRELQDPVIQGIYINLLTDGEITKARDASRDFQYDGTFRDAYMNSNSFIAGKLNSIENTMDACQDLRSVANLYYATESIFAILGEFIDLIPGFEFVSAIRMAIKISAYSSVLTAMGISGYTFMTLPGDIDRTMDDIYLQEGKHAGAPQEIVYPYERGKAVPEVMLALAENLQENTEHYDSVLFEISDQIVAGNEITAVGELRDLMQAESDLRSSFLMASAPFQSVAALAKDSKGDFQPAYDSLKNIYARAGQERMMNYLSVLFAPFDTSGAMRDSVVTGIERTSAMNHAVKDQILTVLDKVLGMELPAVVVAGVARQDKFGLKTGESAVLQLQINNVGALTAKDVYVILKCNPALQVNGEDSVYIGTLAPGAMSGMLTFTVSPWMSSYATGIWEAEIHASNAKTYSANGTFTMHDAVLGTEKPLNSKQIKAYAYPNPFDPSEGPVTFHYRLKVPSAVTISIYDLNGRKIRVLLEKDKTINGIEYTAHWDGRDEAGNIVPDGMYLYVIGTGARDRMTGRIIIMK